MVLGFAWTCSQQTSTCPEILKHFYLPFWCTSWLRSLRFWFKMISLTWSTRSCEARLRKNPNLFKCIYASEWVSFMVQSSANLPFHNEEYIIFVHNHRPPVCGNADNTCLGLFPWVLSICWQAGFLNLNLANAYFLPILRASLFLYTMTNWGWCSASITDCIAASYWLQVFSCLLLSKTAEALHSYLTSDSGPRLVGLVGEQAHFCLNLATWMTKKATW